MTGGGGDAAHEVLPHSQTGEAKGAGVSKQPPGLERLQVRCSTPSCHSDQPKVPPT